MKFFFFSLCLLLLCSGYTYPQKHPLTDAVKSMSLEEKAKLVVGVGMKFPGMNTPTVGQTEDRVPGAAGSTYAIPRLGIPSIVLADGPAGLRISPKREKDSLNTYFATAFPIASALASTWNTDLITTVGKAMGNEVLEYGVDIILMPALNIHRNPLCGRNFEYFSEDPLIAGKMSAAMVAGIQANGVGTSIKHFAANNQETNRQAVSSVVFERALREIYLKGFEIAVKEAHPWTVMSSYNKINGVYASELPWLLTTVLRTDWGFNGLVMTDWFGGKDPAAQMQAGNDLLMPGVPQQTEAIIKAVKEGKLAEAVLDRNVVNILSIIEKTPAYRKYAYSNKPNLKQHAQLSRLAATEGMVLLKNEKQSLPLKTGEKIALFGNAAYETYIGGTGSGDVNEAYSISIATGLKNAGCPTNTSLTELYSTYIAKEKAAQPKPKAWFMPVPPVPEKVITVPEAEQLAKTTDAALYVIGRNSGEFADRKLEDDFTLSATESANLKILANAFHGLGKKMIVLLNIGGVIETAGWSKLADAILLCWQPGQEAGNAVADVLSGKVNPSGKLIATFPVQYQDVPSAAYFPGVPAEKPESVEYKEDIFVGYRHFTTNKIVPAFAFGHGLSYTTFNFSACKVKSSSRTKTYQAELTVTNTGTKPGKEVVQLYISAPSGKLVKPAMELRAFAKTKLLQPGKSQKIQFHLSGKDLASFDSDQKAWIMEKGTYTIRIGSSSDKILTSSELVVSETQIVEKVH